MNEKEIIGKYFYKTESKHEKKKASRKEKE
jgi:hypothetical protein